MAKGWFNLPGHEGQRTLAEQMKGLDTALAEAKDKTVLDLGSAEGLIAFEFAKAGASSVRCIECNAEVVVIGEQELAKIGPLPVRFKVGNVADLIADKRRPQYDIVLALAILHKLREPATGIRYCAESARSLLVVRLQGGSTGRVKSKSEPYNTADLPQILTECGFRCERKAVGPRGEWVQHWRRVC